MEEIDQQIKLPKCLSFVDLPKSVRVRIFREACLVRKCPVGFSQERKRMACRNRPFRLGVLCYPCSLLTYPNFTDYPDNCYGHGLVCTHPPFPIALLRINHQIYEESLELFYSENNFFIDCGDQEAIEILKSASPKALRCITSLFVSFDEHYRRYGRLVALEEGVSNYWKINPSAYKNWIMLCHLFRRHQPSHLSLGLHCWVADTNAIRPVVQGLHILPPLKELRVDFGRFLDVNCSLLDLNTTQRILSQLSTCIQGARNNPEKSFPFEELPAEIQLMVLELCLDMTDRPPLLQEEPEFAEYPALSFKHVKTGLPLLLGDLSRERWCCGYCKPLYNDCCCSHGTSWSSACKCFRPQTSLFAVNRNIRKRAQHIFYTKNRFELTGRSPNPIQRLGRELSLQLRNVCVVMIETPEISTPFSKAVWEHLFREICKRCNGSRLQLEFCARQRYYYDYRRAFDYDVVSHLRFEEPEEKDDISYMKIFHCFIRDLQRRFGPSTITNTFVDRHDRILWENTTLR